MISQEMVDYLRDRHIRGGFGWPGKPSGALAYSWYPNLAAELESHGWLKTMAEFAGVSPEVMAAVIEDGERLTDMEKMMLAARWQARRGYLFCKRMALVDLHTNKGKARRRMLRDKMNCFGSRLGIIEKSSAQDALRRLDAGKIITYASWRYAMAELERVEEEDRRPPVRTERRTVAERRCSLQKEREASL